MEVIYKDGEKERLQERHAEIVTEGLCTFFDDENPERIYGITFKVTNPAIAEYILISLLNNRLENFDIGIDIQSIEFDILPKCSELKAKLHNMIDEIIR